MKKNLEIIGFENKATKSEPPKVYTRFKTSEGWMSCFDETVAKQVKAYQGGVCCVEMTEKDGTNFKGEPMVYKNIIKCYGKEIELVEEAENFTKALDKFEDEKPEVVKIGRDMGKDYEIPKPKNGTATMYTSYAKDIFCEVTKQMAARDMNTEEEDAGRIMSTAIELVKQAREAFE